MLRPDSEPFVPASLQKPEGENQDILTEDPPPPIMYSQEEVNKLLWQKQQEVTEQMKAEKKKIMKEIDELNMKLDDTTIHDKRQLEEIKKLKDTLGREKDQNRQLERVNQGYENARMDNLEETHSLERKGAKEMYRLMMEESNKLYEFANFVKQTVDPDCPELDAFIDQQQKFLTKVKEDPYLKNQGEELKLFQIHRVDWDPESLFMDIFQALRDRENGTFSCPPPQIAPEETPPAADAAASGPESGAVAAVPDDPLTRLVMTVKEVYPDLSVEQVLNALDQIRADNGGRLGTVNQVLEWIASNVLEPKCLVCKELLDRASPNPLFKIPCCGQQFHMGCIEEWLGNQGHCPKCEK